MGIDYVALDIETTGLNPRKDQILEIGAAKVADGEIIETYAVFVDSKIKIPEFITKLTGIDNAMVAGGASPNEAVTGLIEFCKEAPILGHNILFDYSFIKRNATNQGRHFDNYGIDTLTIAKKFLAELPKRNLESLCKHYKIKQEKKHRAYEDAISASRLYHHLRQEFYQVSPAAFDPKELIYQVKKENVITDAQKRYLNDLLKYHKIEIDISIESLTKNEASRIIDGIILKHGRIVR